MSLAAHMYAFATLPGLEVKRIVPPEPSSEMQIIDVEEFVIPDSPEPIEPPTVEPERILDEPSELEVVDDTVEGPDLRVEPPPPPAPLAASRGTDSREFVVFDQAPRPLRTRAPEYPSVARAAEMEGKVLVEVTIDERGWVIDARVLSSEAEIFESAALEAIRQWRFRPAEQSGHPVRARIIVPLEFSLR